MENKLLRSFIAVAKHQNFSAAAKALHTVQPTISRHISDLESELGVQLVMRTTHKVSLTKSGEILLDEAIKILENEKRVKALLIQADASLALEIKIGYLATACSFFLPDIVHQYAHTHRNVSPHLYEMTGKQQLQGLLEGELDLAFCRYQEALDSKLFHKEKVYTDRLVAILPKNHPLASQNEIHLESLANEKYILFERSQWKDIYEQITSLCKQSGFSPNVVDHPDNMRHLVTSISSGLGVSIVPSCIQFIANDYCVCLPIAELDTKIDLYLYYRHNTTNKAHIQMFIDSCLAQKEQIQTSLV